MDWSDYIDSLCSSSGSGVGAPYKTYFLDSVGFYFITVLVVVTGLYEEMRFGGSV